MERRNFLWQCVAIVGGTLLAPLRAVGMVAPAIPDLLDGKPHTLTRLGDRFFIDGIPWAKPWLTCGWDERGLTTLELTKEGVTVAVRTLSIVQPKDDVRPETLRAEMKFTATDTDNLQDIYLG